MIMHLICYSCTFRRYEIFPLKKHACNNSLAAEPIGQVRQLPPLFSPNGQAMLIALPLFAATKWKKRICTDSNKPNLLPPDAFYDQKMYKMHLRLGLCPDPAGELTTLHRPLDLREPLHSGMVERRGGKWMGGWGRERMGWAKWGGG